MKKKCCQAGNRQTGGPGPRTRDPGPQKLRTTAIATQNGNSNSKLAASRFFSSRFLLRVHSTLIISAMLLLLLPLPLVTTWNLHTQFHCCRRIWRSFFAAPRLAPRVLRQSHSITHFIFKFFRCSLATRTLQIPFYSQFVGPAPTIYTFFFSCFVFGPRSVSAFGTPGCLYGFIIISCKREYAEKSPEFTVDFTGI